MNEGPMDISFEPIAIVGLSCRFPGAATAGEFWQLLTTGADAVGQPQRSRLRFEEPASEGQDPVKTATTAPQKSLLACGSTSGDVSAYQAARVNGFAEAERWIPAGYLDQVDEFDAGFFGIAPRQASRIDPCQRLLMEVAWEALEDSGISPQHLRASLSGVFVGISGNEYAQVASQHSDRVLDVHSATGACNSIAANRISYALDLKGPSLAVDTACSSSLVAVHLACQSLHAQECELALACGVQLMLSPDVTAALGRGGVLSPTGRCRAFDASADGYARGEGAGVVVLKPLKQAVADGDAIYAVLRGTAVNQDGRSNGLTAPNPIAQEACLRAAYQRAGLSPGIVQYVEAHGSGTKLGDPIELRALGSVLAEGRPDGNCCSVGTVKSNIGHLEAAAGIAGLIKLALSLKHGLIPPTLHCENPNPLIPLDTLQLKLQTQLGHWSRQNSAPVAAVSSFGFGGTNAHAVLQAVDQSPQADGRWDPRPSISTDRTLLLGSAGACQVPPGDTTEQAPDLLVLSAKSGHALEELAGQFAQFALEHPTTSWQQLAACSREGRSDFTVRLAVAAKSLKQAGRLLGRFRFDATESSGVHCGSRKSSHTPQIAFVFPGQGAFDPHVTQELIDTQPAFADAVARSRELFRSIRSETPKKASEVEAGEPKTDDLNGRQERDAELAIEQFIWQYACCELWAAWGVRPSLVLGHSLGEYAAACCAGVLSLRDCLKLLWTRQQLLMSLPERGTMAAVVAARAQVEPFLNGQGDSSAASEVWIAADNGCTTTLAGRQQPLTETLDRLAAAGIRSVPLQTGFAFHTPLMEPITPALKEAASHLDFLPAQIPLILNLNAQRLNRGERLDPSYFAEQVLEPVAFGRCAVHLAESSPDAVVEISPTVSLLSLLRRVWDATDPGSLRLLPSGRSGLGASEQFFDSLGQLYCAGLSLPRTRQAQPIHGLPTYPFQRRAYPLPVSGAAPSCSIAESPPAQATRQGEPSSGSPTGTTWELSCRRQVHLEDHRIHGQVVVPAAQYLSELATHGPLSALFLRPLILDPAKTYRLEVKYSSASDDGRQSFQILAPKNNCVDLLAYVQGEFHLQDDRQATRSEANGCQTVTAEELKGLREIDPQEVLNHYSSLGLELGPAFRVIRRLWIGDGKAVARLASVPKVALTSLEAQQRGSTGPGPRDPIHPALLDACFHTLAAAFSGSVSHSQLYLPFRVGRLTVYQSSASQISCQAQGHTTRLHPDSLVGDVLLVDGQGQLLATLESVTLKRAPESFLKSWKAGSPPQVQTDRLPTAPLKLSASLSRQSTEVQLAACPSPSPTKTEISEHLPDQGSGRQGPPRDTAWQEIPRPGVQPDSSPSRSAAENPSVDGAQVFSIVWQEHTCVETEEPLLIHRQPDSTNRTSQEPTDSEGGIGDPGFEITQNRATWLVLGPPELIANPPEQLRAQARWISVRRGSGFLQVDEDQFEVSPTKFEDFQQLIERVLAEETIAGIVFAWAIDPCEAQSSENGPSFELLTGLLHLLQSLQGPRWNQLGGKPCPFWVVTQGAQAVWPGESVDPAQAALWGFARSASHERGDLSMRLLDLDPDTSDLSASWLRLLTSDLPESAVRRTARFVPRLAESRASTVQEPEAGGDFRLEISSRGRLDRLGFRPVPSRPAESGEVTLKLGAAGLNFRDVLNALDLYPGDPGPLGCECSGEVLQVGSDVSELKVGDRVFGLASGVMSTAATVSAETLVPIPEGLSPLQAAGLPVAFATAWWAWKLAAIQPGDRVLIHAAAGGVGLAAIALAQRAGAEIYATASQPKWGFLRSLGIEHLFDSRKEELALDIQQASAGRGVDVVLNTLGGGYVSRSLAVLRCRGRFVEIGKREIYSPEQMAELRPDVDYHILALDDLARDNPTLVRESLQELAGLFANGELQVPRHSIFPLSEAQAAFRMMQQAKQIGKIVLRPNHFQTIRQESTYLISGGLGAIGLKTAVWLAQQGATHLAILARQQPPTLPAAIRQLKDQGCQVRILICDVADRRQVQDSLASIAAEMPPLRGVFHAAGILDDAAIAGLTQQRLEKVLAGKVRGAWNLDRATQNLPLDLFVLYSSVASVLGSPGQANYAAANAALDALAHQRRARGLPALSVNWGPWGDGGMATRTTGLADRLRSQGIELLQAETAFSALHGLLVRDAAQAIVTRIHWPQLARIPVHAPSRSVTERFAQLAGQVERPNERSPNVSYSVEPAGSDAPGLHNPTPPAESPTRLQVTGLMELLSRELSETLGLSQAPDVDGDLFELGLDSLMAVELTHRVADQLGPEYFLSPEKLLHHRTIRSVAGALVELSSTSAKSPDEIPATKPPTFDRPKQPTAAPDASVSSQARASEPLLRSSPPVPSASVPSAPVSSAPVPSASVASVPGSSVAGAISSEPIGTGPIGTGPIGTGPAASGWIGSAEASPRTAGGQSGGSEALESTSSPRAEVSFIDSFEEIEAFHHRLQKEQAVLASNPFMRVHQGVAREVIRLDERELINFTSFNYLSLNGTPAVNQAAIASILSEGTSVSASRVVSGERQIHRDLEQSLAEFLGHEAAMATVAGHGTNVSVLGHLFGPGDIIFYDSLAHNSIQQGIRLSRAKPRGFSHNDLDELDRLLTDLRPQARRAVIACEGVYSMDGDWPQLDRLVELKHKHQALLYIDEAHSLGVLGSTGRGLPEHFGLDPRVVDIAMGTLSKSLGSCGAYIAGSHKLVQYLKYTAPTFVFSVGLTPPAAAAALASLRQLLQHPQLVAQLRERSELFLRLLQERGFDTGTSRGTPVVPCILGDSMLCVRLCQRLQQRGIDVLPIVYPGVPEDRSRLRFFVNVNHTPEQLHYTAETLHQEFVQLSGAD